MWGLAPFCFLARSLARLGHGSAASSTDCQGHPQIQWITCRERCEGKVRLRRSRFSIGFAPLTSITNQTLKSVVAKPDRTIKIPGVSPWRLPRALSCSCLSVYQCHSAVMAAVSHSTPDTQLREGSSLQAGLYARTPRSVRLLRLIR